MPNIKLLSSILQKLLQMLKLAQTNQPTDQQTGQKQYVPHYYSGGHKKAQYCSTAIIKIAELLLICGVD